MGDGFLPYGRQWIDDDDVKAVADALRDDMLTTGPKVGEFEEAFAGAVGARYAVVCANGTAALHIAAIAGQVQRGDIGIAPTMSFLASANGMRYEGADIVFADADPLSGLVTPDTFRAAVERAGGKAKMAVVVHLNGHPCDMPALKRIADEHGIMLVEDACHALGTAYATGDGGRSPVGACEHSAMAVFSLHPVKTITMGEGGVVTTDDKTLYDRLRIARTHGMIRKGDAEFQNAELAFAADGSVNPWYYEMQELGYNYRATDFACALGLSQLKKLDMFGERRRSLRARYDRLFGDLGDTVRPVAASAADDPVLHLYPLLINFAAFGKDRAQVMAELKAKGIGTQVHYIPIHRQPYYAQFAQPELPGADAYYAGALSLPYYPQMDDADADRVAAAVKSVLGINA